MLIFLQTIAIGALGAGIAWALGFPAAFLTGPAAFVSLAGLLGMKLSIPNKIRDTVFLILGLTVGTNVTPEILQAAGKWPLSLLAMCVTVSLIMITGGMVFRTYFGMDRQTALLASSPGHLSFVLSFGSDIGANTAVISVIQSMRILILTLLVPVVIAVLTDADMQMRLSSSQTISPLNFTILAVLGLALGLVALKIRVPAAFFLSGMFCSSIGHGIGITPGDLPFWLSSTAFAMMGTYIGTRFSGVAMQTLRQAAFAGVAITLIGLVFAIVAAILVSQLTGLSLISLIIAFAPGGFETMIAMAGAVGADPAFVAFHHVARLFFLSFFVPLILSAKFAR